MIKPDNKDNDMLIEVDILISYLLSLVMIVPK